MNITELAVNLKLPYIRDHWRQLVDEAKHTKQDCAAFLENLLDCEWRQRLENGQTRRIKEAKFPLKKYLVDFKRDKYDQVFGPKFEELETLAFIPNKENIILLGTSGAGKTHLAIALGIAACMKGYNVLFATVPNLILELKETMGHNQLSNYRKRFEKYDLVILDELGYVSMDKSSCEMLFNLIQKGYIMTLIALICIQKSHILSWFYMERDIWSLASMSDAVYYFCTVLKNPGTKL